MLQFIRTLAGGAVHRLKNSGIGTQITTFKMSARDIGMT